MNDDITTETWFDQRPSHPTRPAWYQQAIEDADEAWKAYYAATDEIFDERNPAETKPEEWARLNRLMAEAEAAEAAKEAAYDRWMTGLDTTRGEDHISKLVMA
jgi:hypothetical protein